MQRIFHTPDGFRDIYQEEYKEKKVLMTHVEEVFQMFGYEGIETPTVEYFDVFSAEVGTTSSRELYKFFDKEGDTLVLRPDFTPSIARAASVIMKEKPSLKLYYTGNSFVNYGGLRGRLREQTQMGIENLGMQSADADAEIIAAAVEALRKAGLTEFQISIGHIGFFKALLKEANMSGEVEKELRAMISHKNYFGVEELLLKQNLPEKLTAAFNRMPQLFGSYEILNEARELTDNPIAIEAISRLEEIYNILKLYGVEKYISFDLGMLSKFNYYTGIIFQGVTYGTGEPIVKGGRYDTLLSHFGKSTDAVGFAVFIDQLQLAMDRQKLRIEEASETIVIKYSVAERAKAIEEASALRSQGKCVALELLTNE